MIGAPLQPKISSGSEILDWLVLGLAERRGCRIRWLIAAGLA